MLRSDELLALWAIESEMPNGHRRQDLALLLWGKYLMACRVEVD